jgi:hypothetical protein
MKIFINRMLRAAKLDVNLFEEVAVDSDSLNQSIFIIILSSLAAGIGGITTGGTLLFIFGTIVVLISWLLWAYLTFIISTRLLHTKETRVYWGDVLRTTGFTSTPGLIRILGIIPGLVGIVFLIAGIWMLIAMIIAIRQAFDFETPRTIGICLIGWVIQACEGG